MRAATSNAQLRSRVTAAVIGVIVTASGLTGCTFSAVQANQKAYNPSDGIGETIGAVKVRNALLVTGDGKTANLVVNIANDGVKNVQVHLSWKTSAGRASRNVAVAAGGAVGFGATGNQIILSNVDAPAGSLFPVFFQYGTQEGRDITVPVLDGQLKEYSALVPTASK